ncbi:Asparaginase, putative [Penicillium digitatum]|uniref:Asparaginase, putative n=3 Tax=Penicillium digitatum TaxID=36651 RepID=K9GV68_PEND2|nr:Asparaginase, putative [Penicillium digitatum Pd1]EKV16296.1 Asparaginase, putative [Penicillium digitatum Pd1]EKV18513.1 Asparaginase, putative [Penicillium digitatum PHI26]QQK42561.1 Asparaginase, putative [Penicillium digitatum]
MTKQALFKPTLIIHGGAGNIQRSKLPPDLYAAHHASLQSYLRSTHTILKNGSTALDAAVHAVSLLEDDPLFNCGRGSVFTTAGTIEMEASVMVTSVNHPDATQPGAIKRGAGVMGVRNVRHPIRLARESLLRSGVAADGSPVDDGGSMHSQLVGPYVETLAREWGMEFCSDEWFFTQERWDEHIRGLKGEEEPVVLSQGTVGCVCLDQWGNLAVATSTGGLTNKLPGRIGDTPTLGAGFWAEAWDEIVPGGDEAVTEDSSVGGLLRDARNWLGDCMPSFLRDQALFLYSSLSGDGSSRQLDLGSGKTCHIYQPSAQYSHRRAVAVSGTGNGDSFLRVAAARTVAAMLRFSPPGRFLSGLADAVTAVSGPGGELQRSAGSRWNNTGEGKGGIIGIEAELAPVNRASDFKLHRGKVVFDFNCGGMWRAWVEEDAAGNEVERIMVFREQYE